MEQMLVSLTNDIPASSWGNSDITFNASTAFIHIKDESSLLQIQKAARKIKSLGINKVQLCGEIWKINQQWAFAQGFSDPKLPGEISWCGDESTQTLLNYRLESSHFARELINETPENLPPIKLALSAAHWLQDIAGDKVSYRIIEGEALLKEQYIGIYEVGRGSVRAPAMLELDYNPLTENAPIDVALVGKGITFDSGGYSIKSSQGMLNMKADMGGAATITAALGLAIKQGLNKRVKLFLCCAENLVSGHAYKLGDILTYKNGVSVEIVNTDAEGRLVLADGLIAASATKAPLIIDAATLTGAAKTAVGNMYNAIFSPNDELLHTTYEKAQHVCERVWALPLEPWHKDMCPSSYADTANSRSIKGGGAGGASNAAGFLWRFIEGDAKWLHLDLASAFEAQGNALWGAGATAHGVLTIAELLKD